MRERLADWKESLSVKWFMLDAQTKQAVLIGIVALWQIGLDIGGEWVKSRFRNDPTSTD